MSGEKGLGCMGDEKPGEEQTVSRTIEEGEEFWRLDVASGSRGSSAQRRPPARALHLRVSEAVPCFRGGGCPVLALPLSLGLVVLPRPGITQIPLNTWLQMRTLEKKAIIVTVTHGARPDTSLIAC